MESHQERRDFDFREEGLRCPHCGQRPVGFARFLWSAGRIKECRNCKVRLKAGRLVKVIHWIELPCAVLLSIMLFNALEPLYESMPSVASIISTLAIFVFLLPFQAIKWIYGRYEIDHSQERRTGKAW